VASTVVSRRTLLRGSGDPVTALADLMARAEPGAAFGERLRWLAELTRWVVRPELPRGESGTRAPRDARLRLLLGLLDGNPGWKAVVARTVRATVREIDVLEVFTETGLPREGAPLREALDRIAARLLPRDPDSPDLEAVLRALFPRSQDAEWLESIDDDALSGVAEVLPHAQAAAEDGWNTLRRDLPHALIVLAAELAATGLSGPVRRRLGGGSFRDLPFYALPADAAAFAAAVEAGRGAAARAAAIRMLENLGRTRACIEQAGEHLDAHGLSVALVYRLERITAQTRRAERLLELAGGRASPRAVATFLAQLVRDNVERASLRRLLAANTHLLARKVVDRAAETGAHYIARTRREYLDMVRSAAGGGLVTVATTWLKLGVSALHAAPFVEGVLASLNYAASFIAIQLAHFTLATKQPAMTGPALARRLEHVGEPGGIAAFVDEAVDLLRSQAAAIFGNLATVVPGVVAVNIVAELALGRPLLGPEKALYVINSISLAGPTPVYAVLTGVLLFSSSLVAGWADNWFAFRGQEAALASHRHLGRLLGPARAARFAHWLRENVSGLAGNVSLGFMLGMTPALGRFLGVPLDVRHVTLSAGFLAAAVSSLGVAAIGQGRVAWAIGGVASMALLNVGVSFALAMFTAVRARSLRAPERSAIRSELWHRLLRRPFAFLVPPAERSPAAAGH
jgi:site-specific recombinase